MVICVWGFFDGEYRPFSSIWDDDRRFDHLCPADHLDDVVGTTPVFIDVEVISDRHLQQTAAVSTERIHPHHMGRLRLAFSNFDVCNQLSFPEMLVLSNLY